MNRLTILTGALIALAIPALASPGHEEEMAAGKPGDAGHVDRTVEVSMIETDDGEMLFEPRNLRFAEGETVRLVITNDGEQEHEFVLDSLEENQEHRATMERFPEMEHDDPNAIRLEPEASGEIVWTFTKTGEFEFACLIPGHYDAGMHGPVVVE